MGTSVQATRRVLSSLEAQEHVSHTSWGHRHDVVYFSTAGSFLLQLLLSPIGTLLGTSLFSGVRCWGPLLLLPSPQMSVTFTPHSALTTFGKRIRMPVV